MELTESLKRFRKNFNLKQKDVADVLGVTPQAYQVYESKVTPSANVIINISKAFGISADYLLGLTDNPRPLVIETQETELKDKSADDIQIIKERLTKLEDTVAKLAS